MTIDNGWPRWRRNTAENFNRLSRAQWAHERYRRQTDGFTTTYSKRERKFTYVHVC